MIPVKIFWPDFLCQGKTARQTTFGTLGKLIFVLFKPFLKLHLFKNGESSGNKA